MTDSFIKTQLHDHEAGIIKSFIKHNDMIMKQELLQCFLCEDVLSNRVSLFVKFYFVLIDKIIKKKDYCSIPLAMWASIKHIYLWYSPQFVWSNQSTVRGCKIFCQSARAFPSFWKCKWIHTSNYTYFEMFDSQATIHGSPKQNWGQPSPCHHPKTNLPSQCLVGNNK